jgi:hypothetical protein
MVLVQENLRAAIVDVDGRDPDKDQLLESYKQYLANQGGTGCSPAQQPKGLYMRVVLNVLAIGAETNV